MIYLEYLDFIKKQILNGPFLQVKGYLYQYLMKNIKYKPYQYI